MTGAEAANRPVSLASAAELEAFVASHDRALVEFHTEGCSACAAMEPVLSGVAKSTDVAVATMNPRDDPALLETYDVRSVPKLLLFEDGDLVADDYPTEFTRGESRSLVVGVTNQEHRPTNYTVLVQLQRVRVANNSTTVLEESRLKQWDVELTHNETWHLNHTVTPRMTGDRLRLAYLLYAGEPPAEPTVDNAYRELHLWINVSDPSASVSPAAIESTRTAAVG